MKCPKHFLQHRHGLQNTTSTPRFQRIVALFSSLCQPVTCIYFSVWTGWMPKTLFTARSPFAFPPSFWCRFVGFNFVLSELVDICTSKCQKHRFTTKLPFLDVCCQDWLVGPSLRSQRIRVIRTRDHETRVNALKPDDNSLFDRSEEPLTSDAAGEGGGGHESYTPLTGPSAPPWCFKVMHC